MSDSNESPAATASPERPRLSDALIAVLLPAFGYCLAFAYESGYCSYFHIPNIFIVVSLTSVLIAVATLASGVWFVYYYVNPFYGLISAHLRTATGRSIARTALLVAFLVLFARVTQSPFSEAIVWILVVVTFFVAIEFVLPLLTQRKVEGYASKLEAQEATEGSVLTVSNLLYAKVGKTAYHIVFFGVLLIFLASAGGWGKARKEREYLVTETSPSLVVLRAYGETVILAECDLTTQTVKPAFRFVKLTDAANLSLRLTALGPLRFGGPVEMKAVAPAVSVTPPQVQTITASRTSPTPSKAGAGASRDK